jgi:uncharacterized membrane protein
VTRKERTAVYEGGAIAFVAVFGAFVIPALVSVRDSVVAVAGGMLFIGWLIWLAYFVYRMRRI